jgi:hypothetical protein
VLPRLLALMQIKHSRSLGATRAAKPCCEWPGAATSHYVGSSINWSSSGVLLGVAMLTALHQHVVHASMRALGWPGAAAAAPPVHRPMPASCRLGWQQRWLCGCGRWQSSTWLYELPCRAAPGGRSCKAVAQTGWQMICKLLHVCLYLAVAAARTAAHISATCQLRQSAPCQSQ